MKSIVLGFSVFLGSLLSFSFSTAVADISWRKWEILDPALAHSIDEAGWSLETVDPLKAVGIDYIGSLVDRTEKELPPDLTLKSLTEIKDWLAERGLRQGMKLHWPTNKTEEVELVRKLRQDFAEGRNPVFARTIDSMDWSPRTKNALKNEAVYSIGSLVKMTQIELLKIPNFGRKNITEITDWLTPRGLWLGMNIPWPSDRGQEKELVNKLNPPLDVPEELIPLLTRSISSMPWSTRTKNALTNEEVYSVGALVKMTEEELRKIPDFGKKSMTEVKDWLTPKGLRSGMDIQWPSDRGQEKELMNKLNPLQDVPEELIPLLTRSISSMPWSTRTKNVLTNEEIYSIGALVKMTEEELRKIPNFNKKSMADVKGWLIQRGLRLGMNISWPSDRGQEKKLVNKMNVHWPHDPRKEAEWIQKLNPIEEWKGVGNGFLTFREESVLKMRFGIGENPHTLRAVGEFFNVTPEKIKQIQARALNKLYEKGMGINPDILYDLGVKLYERKNPFTAARLWRSASDQGHMEAQYSLGYLYSKGEGVMKKDLKKATQLWEQAAAQGHEEARRSLDEQEQCSPNLFQKLNKK